MNARAHRARLRLRTAHACRCCVFGAHAHAFAFVTFLLYASHFYHVHLPCLLTSPCPYLPTPPAILLSVPVPGILLFIIPVYMPALPTTIPPPWPSHMATPLPIFNICLFPNTASHLCACPFYFLYTPLVPLEHFTLYLSAYMPFLAFTGENGFLHSSLLHSSMPIPWPARPRLLLCLPGALADHYLSLLCHLVPARVPCPFLPSPCTNTFAGRGGGRRIRRLPLSERTMPAGGQLAQHCGTWRM